MFGECSMEAKVPSAREAEIAELFAWGASKKDIAGTPFHFGTDGGNHARTYTRKVLSARNSTFF